MRRFHLVRTVDISGVSGTGVVAEGVQFLDGTVVYKWRPRTPGGPSQVAVWESIEDCIAVHGHGGATTVHWLDDEPGPTTETRASPPAGQSQAAMVDSSQPATARRPWTRLPDRTTAAVGN